MKVRVFAEGMRLILNAFYPLTTGRRGIAAIAKLVEPLTVEIRRVILNLIQLNAVVHCIL